MQTSERKLSRIKEEHMCAFQELLVFTIICNFSCKYQPKVPPEALAGAILYPAKPTPFAPILGAAGTFRLRIWKYWCLLKIS